MAIVHDPSTLISGVLTDSASGSANIYEFGSLVVPLGRKINSQSLGVDQERKWGAEDANLLGHLLTDVVNDGVVPLFVRTTAGSASFNALSASLNASGTRWNSASSSFSATQVKYSATSASIGIWPSTGTYPGPFAADLSGGLTSISGILMYAAYKASGALGTAQLLQQNIVSLEDLTDALSSSLYGVVSPYTGSIAPYASGALQEIKNLSSSYWLQDFPGGVVRSQSLQVISKLFLGTQDLADIADGSGSWTGSYSGAALTNLRSTFYDLSGAFYPTSASYWSFAVGYPALTATVAGLSATLAPLSAAFWPLSAAFYGANPANGIITGSLLFTGSLSKAEWLNSSDQVVMTARVMSDPPLPQELLVLSASNFVNGLAIWSPDGTYLIRVNAIDTWGTDGHLLHLYPSGAMNRVSFREWTDTGRTGTVPDTISIDMHALQDDGSGFCNAYPAVGARNVDNTSSALYMTPDHSAMTTWIELRPGVLDVSATIVSMVQPSISGILPGLILSGGEGGATSGTSLAWSASDGFTHLISKNSGRLHLISDGPSFGVRSVDYDQNSQTSGAWAQGVFDFDISTDRMQAASHVIAATQFALLRISDFGTIRLSASSPGPNGETGIVLKCETGDINLVPMVGGVGVSGGQPAPSSGAYGSGALNVSSLYDGVHVSAGAGSSFFELYQGADRNASWDSSGQIVMSGGLITPGTLQASGGLNCGGAGKVVNMAAGTVSTDAVNYGQFQPVSSTLVSVSQSVSGVLNSSSLSPTAIYIRSPNSSTFRITIGNDGVLSSTLV